MAENLATFEVYQDAAAEWRWTFRASNGKILGDSAEGYKERADCEAALALLKKVAAGSPVKPQKPRPPKTAMPTPPPTRVRPSLRKK